MEELSCKIKTIKFRMGKTNDVIGKHDKEALERQRLSVTTISIMVNTLKENIEEGMFTKGDTEEQVKDWAAKLIDGLPFNEEGYSKAKVLLEKKYGQTSEVVGAYVRSILELPTIRERDVPKIHAFYEILLYNVESLQTLDSLGSLGKLDAAVRFTFDKLEVIKSELAMTNENWSEWTFTQFVDVLERWTKNNPVRDNQGGKSRKEKGKSFFANQDNNPNHGIKGCLYCSNETHRAINCDKVVKPEDRKKLLAEKHLCFNCTGAKHRAADCKSKVKCQICQGKHHTSICDKNTKPREPGMTANHIGQSTVIHPVVVVRINGYKFRALLDSGASHSYASSTAIKLSGAKVKSVGLRQIAMLTGVTTRTMQVYEVRMQSLSGDFDLDVNVTKIEKRELLSLENPHYKDVLEKHSHLRGVRMDDDYDKKELLPMTMLRYVLVRICELGVAVNQLLNIPNLVGPICPLEQRKKYHLAA